MENKEIKLELAKVALEKCCFTTSETLTEGLKNLYEWVVEDPEVEDEATDKNSFDSINIKEVLNIVRKNQRFGSGIATSLETIFSYKNDINTVGDLIRIGRCGFSKYRNVGNKTVCAIDDALNELGIKGW